MVPSPRQRKWTPTWQKVDPLFKIRKVDVKEKQRDKTAVEFGEALTILLGRKADIRAMDYSTFRDCLSKMMLA